MELPPSYSATAPTIAANRLQAFSVNKYLAHDILLAGNQCIDLATCLPLLSVLCRIRRR